MLERLNKLFTVDDIESFKRKILHISTHFENSIILNSNHSSTDYDLIFAYGLHSFLSSNENSLKKLDDYVNYSKDWLFGFFSYDLKNEKFAGFCYIEIWGHGKYVAHSGLIVSPEFRGIGLAKLIKKKTFEYSKKKYPQTKIFGITTGLPVMKINYSLGYEPVTFSELTDDDEFWKGCQTCNNYDILQRTKRKMCLCTGMLYNPKKNK